MRILCLALLLFIMACQSPAPETKSDTSEKLGTISINFTGNEAAMPHFEKGLLLLHNFEFEDACTAFLKAQEADSTMAMAYWGEAMTYNHPLWREQDYEKGQAALAKWAETPEERQSKTTSALERDLLQSLDILYGEGDKKERDIAYNKFYSKLYEKYPGNQEVAAFYALSCLGAVTVGRDKAAYEKGAAIAQGILDENPNHPGALHYLIHSYDDPEHAPLALPAANSYSKVAANATHALHMPSHIYVAVGMWDEVVNSNLASWKASVRRMEDKDLSGKARSYHALHWLLYGYLQKGQYGKATQVMEDMKGYLEEEQAENMRIYLVGMKGSYLVETGQWDHPLADYETEIEDLNVRVQNVFHFLEGMKAHEQGNTARVDATILKMAKEIAFAETLVTEKGTPMCSAANSYRKPNSVDIDQSRVLEWMLRGLRAWEQPAAAEEWLKKATELEARISYSYGPPVIVQPSFELYGRWLLEQGRAEEAAEQFEQALERGPRRVMALWGHWKASAQNGDAAATQAAQDELQKVLREAEPSVRKRWLGPSAITQR
ncbi:MAG: hypothetical protein AAGG75_14345 [Bacteroidota bacterium]